jgi:hypothetical protein
LERYENQFICNSKLSDGSGRQHLAAAPLLGVLQNSLLDFAAHRSDSMTRLAALAAQRNCPDRYDRRGCGWWERHWCRFDAKGPTSMPTPTDTQAILLARAARRPSGSLYPLPDTLSNPAGASRSITALVSRCWAEERETTEASAANRHDGDLHYGMFITAAGLAAIGLAAGEGAETGAEAAAATAVPTTKAATLLALLGREQGATLADLIDATGWLPHTTRAALTRLRKKGHTLDKSKREGTTCYRLVAA